MLTILAAFSAAPALIVLITVIGIIIAAGAGMTAATEAKVAGDQKPGLVEGFPVQASSKILAGWLVAVGLPGQGAGVAGHVKSFVGSTDSLTHAIIGIAENDADNSSGAAAAIECNVDISGREVKLVTSGMVITDATKEVYVVDNQTCQLAPTASGQKNGKISRFVSATEVWVRLFDYDKALDTASANSITTLAAAGTTQATAAAIVSDITFVTGADGVTGVVLPTAVEGLGREVYNAGTSPLLVYPATSDDIDDQSANIAVVLGPESGAKFRAIGGTTWVSTLPKASAQILTANSDSGLASTVLPSATSVDVQGVTADANDWIVLPALADVPNGHEIVVLCNASSNFEMRTPAASAEEINSEDCDGTKEYLMTDTQVVKVVKINDTIGWMAHGFTAIGAVAVAVIPD
jgi:hypothetical protein